MNSPIQDIQQDNQPTVEQASKQAWQTPVIDEMDVGSFTQNGISTPSSDMSSFS